MSMEDVVCILVHIQFLSTFDRECGNTGHGNGLGEIQYVIVVNLIGCAGIIVQKLSLLYIQAMKRYRTKLHIGQSQVSCCIQTERNVNLAMCNNLDFRSGVQQYGIRKRDRGNSALCYSYEYDRRCWNHSSKVLFALYSGDENQPQETIYQQIVAVSGRQ